MTTSNAQNSKNHYDVVVLGSNLTAWLTASMVERSGPEKIALITPKHENALAPLLNTDFQIMPETDENKELLTWLNSVLPESITYESIEASPKTFESGSTKPFVGFGGRKLETADMLNDLNQSYWLSLNFNTTQLISSLTSSFQGEILSSSEVTSFEKTEENTYIITLNGSKKITASRVVFSEPPSSLLELFSQSTFSPRTNQKLSKPRNWSSVFLHFQHAEPVLEDNSIYFLMGNKDQFEPCVGRLFPITLNEDKQAQQISLWMSLVPTESLEDDEYVGSVIRNMKRQIKRPFPNALDNLEREKIVILEHQYGYMNLGLDDNCELGDLPHFHICHPLTVAPNGLPGDLLAAKNVLSSLLRLSNLRDSGIPTQINTHPL